MNQKCWADLLRELRAIEDRPNGSRDDWLDFAKPLQRIDTDAVRLATVGDTVSPEQRDEKLHRLQDSVPELADTVKLHSDAQRLAKCSRTDGRF